jgi:hypothetical protein
MMRPRTIVGILLILAGGTFALQGLNLLPGSSAMNGRPEWVVIGAAMVVAGVALLVAASRRPPAR